MNRKSVLFVFCAMAFAGLPGSSGAFFTGSFEKSYNMGAQTARPCAGGLCMNVRESPEFGDGYRVIYLTFSGSDVSHYNVRGNEPGGREIQREVRTNSNKTNQSLEWLIKTSAKYTIKAQACNRGGVLQRSGCSGWKILTVRF